MKRVTRSRVVHLLFSMVAMDVASSLASTPVTPGFPDRFDEPFHLAAGGQRIALRAIAARSAPAERSGSVLAYPGAYPETDVWYVVTPRRVEEFLHLASPGAPTCFEYELVDAQGVEEVRAEEGGVRFGYTRGPSLRIERPLVIDAAGRSREGAWQVAGDVRRPRLILRLDPRGLTYPLLVDPSWSTTTPLVEKHSFHTTTLLPDGGLLTVGLVGELASGFHLAAERFDAAAATWAPLAPPPSVGAAHTATLLAQGEVLLAGGHLLVVVPQEDLVATDAAVRFNPRAGSWRPAARLHEARAGHTATRLGDGRVLVLGGEASWRLDDLLGSAELYDGGTDTWTDAVPLPFPRSQHTATLLRDGRVLIAGGYEIVPPATSGAASATAWICDPVASTWARVADMSVARREHTATLLADGTVLVASDDTAELFDPATGMWRSDPPFPWANGRREGSATLLPSGQVLAAGGSESPPYVADLYDPATGMWSPAGARQFERRGHTETLLPGGRVLLVGGGPRANEVYDPEGSSWQVRRSPASGQPTWLVVLPGGQILGAGTRTDGTGAELYDPATDTWSPTGDLPVANSCAQPLPPPGCNDGTATLLPDGRVLALRGRSAMLYEPASGTWRPTTALDTDRWAGGYGATLLRDGRVLVTGGLDTTGQYLSLAAVEVFDPATETWTEVAPMSQRRGWHAATLLRDGRVLVAGGLDGGYSGGETLSSAEVYDPDTDSWTFVASLDIVRLNPGAALLADGRVLVVGGGGAFSRGTGEIFDPATGRWSPAATLVDPASEGHLVLLPDRRALSVGDTGSAEVFDPMTGKWTTVAAGPAGTSTGPGARALALLPDGRILAVGDAAAAYSWSVYPTARRPVIATATDVAYGTPLRLSGSGFDGDSEGTVGSVLSSPTNHPLVQLRALESGRIDWLVWDPLATLAGDPLDLTVSDLPTVDVGWNLLTVFANGIPSVSRIIRASCGLAITTQPANQVVDPGATATFTVSAQGARRYQWRKSADGTTWNIIPGANGASYTTPPIGPAESGTLYACDIAGICAADRATSQPATLTVRDGEPPTVRVDAPAGGEFWPLSQDLGSPITRLVAWTMSDDVRICRVDVRLYYSDDGGRTYQEAPPGGGLPATFPPGGGTIPCAFPGTAATSLTYTLPVTPPSGHPGSLYKIRVVATDHAGRPSSDRGPDEGFSARPFFIVDANPDSVRTLVLWHPARMAAELGTDVTALGEKLGELAAHPRVLGLLIDLGGVPSLDPLYATWDGNRASADAANAVLFGAGGIHPYLQSLFEVYRGLHYLVVVGDDRIVPMARMVDRAALLPESAYPAGGDLTPTGTTVGQALAADRFLSDDPLAVRDPIALGALGSSLFVPDLSIGRLVETPEEVIATIATYISQDGVLDISSLDPAEHDVMVTGYDFLNDAARSIRRRWKVALGVCAPADPCSDDASLAPVDGKLVEPGWASTVSARRDELLAHLSGNGGGRYGVVSLNGHATHYLEGVPGADPFDIQGLAASDIYGGSICGSPPAGGAALGGSVVYSVGCHGGLPVAGCDAGDGEHSLDLPQTFLARGVVAYVANSGYGWGLQTGLGYGERLVELLTEELTGSQTVPFGEAVREAKLRYLLESPRIDPYDTKSLMQWTVFGLPMYDVHTGIGPRISPGAATSKAVEADEFLGAVRVRRRQIPAGAPSSYPGPQLPAGAAGVVLPPHLTALQLRFDLTANGVYRKWTAAGTEVLPPAPGEPIPTGCADPQGCYYTLNGLVERSTGACDLPIQPYLVYDSRLSGTSQHGVLWLGGEFDEEDSWIPVLARLQSSESIPTDPGSAPLVTLISPIGTRTVPGTDPAACAASDLELNRLVVSTGEAVKAAGSGPIDPFTIERIYRSVDLEVFYFNNPTASGDNCDREGPRLGDGPFAGSYHRLTTAGIEWAVPAADPAGVWRIVVVVEDGTRRWAWSPIELEDDGSGVWRGARAAGDSRRLTYLIEAVDARGNVSWLDYATANLPGEPIPVLPASGIPLGVPQPVVEAGLPFADADGDGMSDAWEIDHGLDPGRDDGNRDPDRDGLTNLGEFTWVTEPHRSDSDGDGENDGSEAGSGRRNPLRAWDGKAVRLSLLKSASDVVLDWRQSVADPDRVRGYFHLRVSSRPDDLGGRPLLWTSDPAPLGDDPPGAGLQDGIYTHSGAVPGAAATVSYYSVTDVPVDTAAAPEVEFITPASAPQGTSIWATLFGRNFTVGARVVFAGTDASSVLVRNGNAIDCLAPPLSAGAVDVTVVNPGGRSDTLPLGFTYLP